MKRKFSFYLGAFMKKHNFLPSVLGVLLAACAVSAHADPIGLDVSVGLVNIRPDIKSPVVGADATNEVVPIANFTYYLSEHFALNTAAGITRHEFSNAGGILGKASMAPFHLMAQYHFMPKADFIFAMASPDSSAVMLKAVPIFTACSTKPTPPSPPSSCFSSRPDWPPTMSRPR
ncbi:OmpW family outer membrane protein, partial [Thiobacillus sp. SCN 63-57]|uniref:OmpW family outer membrane protein n=1 Tax=Thiobacillus sp. SCN 63-57 TaxID=1660145 RepID=UPI0025E9CF70